jgi:integrase
MGSKAIKANDPAIRDEGEVADKKEPTRIKANDLAIRGADVGRHQVADKNGLTQGLYLNVNANGSRRFLWRYVSPLTNKPNEAGLGSYPQTTLAAAKKTVIEWRALVREGICPVAHRRAKKLAVKTDGKSLRDVLDLYAEEFKAHAGAREGVGLIERHAATLLTRPANDEIAPVEIKATLAGVIAATPKTAARTRAALSTLFEYAIANDYRTLRDPAAKAIFKKLMPPPPKSTPHRMMPPADVPKLFNTLTAMGSISSLALAYLILVAGRTSEVLGLHSREIDLDKRLVVIPGSRMKAGVEHRYPISDPALAILTEMRVRHGADGYVFRAKHGGRSSDRRLEGLLHQKLDVPYSVHGFRASFSSWSHAETDHPHELIELALAHNEGRGNSVARAYNRSDALERRRQLMADWAAFVAGEVEPTA